MKVAVVLMLLLLPACASTFTGLCAVQPIGQNEQGQLVLMAQCEPPPK